MLNPSAGSERDPADGVGVEHGVGAGAGGGGVEAEKRMEAAAVGQGAGGSAGYVEFLPVEWFTEVTRLEDFVLVEENRVFVLGGVIDRFNSLRRYGTKILCCNVRVGGRAEGGGGGVRSTKPPYGGYS